MAVTRGTQEEVMAVEEEVMAVEEVVTRGMVEEEEVQL